MLRLFRQGPDLVDELIVGLDGAVSTPIVGPPSIVQLRRFACCAIIMPPLSVSATGSYSSTADMQWLLLFHGNQSHLPV